MSSDLRGLGRFTESSLGVLISLTEGQKDSYAILLDLERLAGRRVGPGTLYGALGRLEARGLIEALDVDEVRRPYRLTEAGSRAIAAQRDSLEASAVRLRTLGHAQE